MKFADTSSGSHDNTIVHEDNSSMCKNEIIVINKMKLGSFFQTCQGFIGRLFATLTVKS